MLFFDGGEVVVRVFQSCFKGQMVYDEKVFLFVGIIFSDLEFNFCVFNYVLYVGKLFGKMILENSIYLGLDLNSKFRFIGIDGNRFFCIVIGYL